jgi:hypothetical protein
MLKKFELATQAHMKVQIGHHLCLVSPHNEVLQAAQKINGYKIFASYTMKKLVEI